MNEMETLRDVRAPATLVANVLRGCGLMDRYTTAMTPLGRTCVGVSTAGITLVLPCEDDLVFEERYRERIGRRCERDDSVAPYAAEMLSAQETAVAVDLRRCNAFQRAVLHAASEIPKGSVRPYAWIAEKIGKPKAVRAVGTALAQNPVPLAVPCHRVVRSDGLAGEYVFGSRHKTILLKAEGVDLEEVHRRLHDREHRFWTTEGEDTYCRPYCFDARPLARPFITFRSAAAARAHGLMPCPTCQPLAAA